MKIPYLLQILFENISNTTNLFIYNRRSRQILYLLSNKHIAMSAVANPGGGASEVVDRSMRDEQFLEGLRSSPEDVLEEYDLTDEEMDALSGSDDENVLGAMSAAPAKYNVTVVVVVSG